MHLITFNDMYEYFFPSIDMKYNKSVRHSLISADTGQLMIAEYRKLLGLGRRPNNARIVDMIRYKIDSVKCPYCDNNREANAKYKNLNVTCGSTACDRLKKDAKNTNYTNIVANRQLAEAKQRELTVYDIDATKAFNLAYNAFYVERIERSSVNAPLHLLDTYAKMLGFAPNDIKHYTLMNMLKAKIDSKYCPICNNMRQQNKHGAYLATCGQYNCNSQNMINRLQSHKASIPENIRNAKKLESKRRILDNSKKYYAAILMKYEIAPKYIFEANYNRFVLNDLSDRDSESDIFLLAKYCEYLGIDRCSITARNLIIMLNNKIVSVKCPYCGISDRMKAKSNRLLLSCSSAACRTAASRDIHIRASANIPIERKQLAINKRIMAYHNKSAEEKLLYSKAKKEQYACRTSVAKLTAIENGRLTREQTKHDILNMLGDGVEPNEIYGNLFHLANKNNKIERNRIVNFILNKYPSLNRSKEDVEYGIKLHNYNLNINAAICNNCKSGKYRLIIMKRFADACNECMPDFIKSDGEVHLKSFIASLNIECRTDRTILKGKELDIYIPSHNLAIEYNGNYFHSTLKGKDANYHIDKTEECYANNIQLLHVWEHIYLAKSAIVESIIKSKLGIYDNRIYARKCDIRELTAKDVREFTETNHLQGHINAGVYIGLFHQDILYSVMTFGHSRFKNVAAWELFRYCCKQGIQIIGGASKLLKYFEKTFKPNKLISYCNRDWSDGSLYYSLGFDYIGRTDYYFYMKSGIEYNRLKCQKHLLPELLGIGFDPNISESANMEENGFLRCETTGNLIFSKSYID